ncbi:MAG: proline--tRNA ligase [Treponema sp.]|nr:proline--tRNA ligase [Treponema sp.]
MKASQFIISTLRDAPNDAVIASHQLMMKSGMLRKLGNGLYSYMPLGYRSFIKVQQIIREELNNAGCLEMKPTVIQPGEIWKESGRWDKMAGEMLTPQNRAGQDMVVSPTAEEAFTALVREGLTSYKQLPFTLYQINTKYRDEIRPRYGVMRGREFTMMDAYSFDADKESLDKSYDKVAEAYHKIFKRVGLTIIPVKADTGSMGGSGSEEFMVESPVGDDTLLLCPDCKYAANVEKASCKREVPLNSEGKPQVKTDLPMEEVATPNVFSIEDMVKFFNESSTTFLKALIYKVYNCGIDLSKTEQYKNAKTITEGGITYLPECFVCVIIRGDLDVNETKLAAQLKATGAELASDEDVLKYSGAPHGFVGPMGLKIPVIADESTIDMHDCVAGSGKEGFHVKHVEPGRDFTPFMTVDVRTVVEGDGCPECGSKLYVKKGNELGHIFKLGDKYTKSMNVTYLDQSGKPVTPIMGCYGIGVDRTLASIIEEHHDDKGIIWPMSVAPFTVAIVPIKYDGAMKEAADKLYEELTKAGVEVLLDDRNERPGVKFNDADLIGFPIRIVVGDKNLPNVEFKMRNCTDAELVPAEEAAQKAISIVNAELSKLNN